MKHFALSYAQHHTMAPHDDCVPFQVEKHPDTFFWCEEYVPSNPRHREPPGIIPSYWYRHAGQQPDGTWKPHRWGSVLVEARDVEHLKELVNEMRF